ncbi:MAG TPA: glycosyltransferase [Magnetospirillaceae bacterium]|jgi:UDP:flavonoid glycosyltransferase YjiC (YdhE family)
MKFVVATYGTEGDTRPLSALSRGLMDAGHEVRLFADGATLGSPTSLGIPATALAGDMKAVLRDTNVLTEAGGSRVRNLAAAFAQIANANTAAWMKDIAAAAQGGDAILVSGLAAFVGFSVAEYLDIPAIGLGLIPITPTAAFASPFLPPRTLPGWLNRPSHRFVNAMVWRAFRTATNVARAAVCKLPPRRAVWTDLPMLYGVSPSLLPRPGDWPEDVHVCGQWLTRAPEWTPPPSLSDFLNAGEPPLYVGFGSMAGFERRKLLDVVIAAVAGRRALFYGGWSGVDAAELPANFLAIGETPHDWLFPKTSLVVHHGGSGTTHSAARAGVPSVVVPFAGDQPFWADRLRLAGVAAPATNAKALTSAALAGGIAFAERTDTRARAATLGKQMATEDGRTAAVTAIETIMSKRRPHL